MSEFESQWSSTDRSGRYFSQMLPLVDHNQVKMVFASRPPKSGRIGGKEVDLNYTIALKLCDNMRNSIMFPPI